jgi:hypothetical protein
MEQGVLSPDDLTPRSPEPLESSPSVEDRQMAKAGGGAAVLHDSSLGGGLWCTLAGTMMRIEVALLVTDGMDRLPSERTIVLGSSLSLFEWWNVMYEGILADKWFPPRAEA